MENSRFKKLVAGLRLDNSLLEEARRDCQVLDHARNYRAASSTGAKVGKSRSIAKEGNIA